MPGTSSVWSSPVSLKVGDKTIIKKNVEDKMERIFFLSNYFSFDLLSIFDCFARVCHSNDG